MPHAEQQNFHLQNEDVAAPHLFKGTKADIFFLIILQLFTIYSYFHHLQ